MDAPADPHTAAPRGQSSTTTHVAIDCEMVQIVGGKQVLAHICAVDWNEAVLVNTYVAPGAPVKDYLTRYSGLRPGDLDGAPTFDSVRAQVAALLEGSILVGHAPSNDLRALQLKHPAELTCDTAALDWGEQKRGLGSLCREVLGVDIQAGTHSPQEDAIASLRLLKYHQAHGAPPLRTVAVVLRFSMPAPRPSGLPCAVEAVEAEEAGEAAGEAAAVAGEVHHACTWTLRVAWSREQRGALLHWFKKAREAPAPEGAPEGAPADAPAEAAAVAALVFPPSLSKTERGAVHKEAQALKLPTESSGVDEERFITVLAQPPAEQPPPPPQLRHVATMVYRWAQEAVMDAACDAANGGQPVPRAAARPLSLGELVELLSRGLALPPPYAALHERAERLLEAAGSTLPPLDAGVGAAERTRRDWQRDEWCRVPL